MCRRRSGPLQRRLSITVEGCSTTYRRRVPAGRTGPGSRLLTAGPGVTGHVAMTVRFATKSVPSSSRPGGEDVLLSRRLRRERRVACRGAPVDPPAESLAREELVDDHECSALETGPVAHGRAFDEQGPGGEGERPAEDLLAHC